ncbi:MAG TPA: PilZ domain-containing protein [Candidatus Omnitrophota bacterium]|nr:PilZ domain-containing protein [Candidatus Omnitrophota bacterium]
MLQHDERRRFIRHPICYPLEFEYASAKTKERTSTINVSKGGLLFVAKHSLPLGKTIILKMPLKDKLFKIKGKVVHITPDEDNPKLYNVGIAFYSFSDAFKVKLIEQIYLIDEYRALRSVQLGREVAFKDASEEWIRRYSKRFAKLYW